MKLSIIPAATIHQIRAGVETVFRDFRHVFPNSPKARILLKPNLNAHMNALTGNTTDLRLIASTIGCLKDMGYQNITIGEGTNSGYYRNRISVISRLRVDRLARYFGVEVVDLNLDQPRFIPFQNGVQAGVAETCFQADFWINMPKLKTHFETGMSVCLKNLIGCLVGQENKKKTHLALVENILNLNRQLKPHLHLVDGLISMEGLGPTRGRPVHLGLILGGTDPYLLDLVCAGIAGFNYRNVRTLATAEKQGLIEKAHLDYVRSLDLRNYTRNFEPPRPGLLASFIHSPRRQRYFLALRNTRLFSRLAATSWFGHLLFWSGLRQDRFIQEEMNPGRLIVDKDRCRPGCTRCSDYCPMGLDLQRREAGDPDCIGCLYCFLVCPQQAIGVDGQLGFMEEQLKQYDRITRRVCNELYSYGPGDEES